MKYKKKRKYSKKKKNASLYYLLAFVLLIVIIFFGVGLFSQNHLVSFMPSNGIFTSHKDKFIDEMAPHAVELQEEYGVLPSITIAQGILESDWGQSSLAQEENNYYGIKGNQNSSHYVTREFTGEWIETSEPFESYDSMEDSMKAHAKLLANGPSWDPNHYQRVIEASNYKEAAVALQEAGYATDPSYSDKLISIIESYNLNQFDIQ